jgi:putative oxidoreductase
MQGFARNALVPLILRLGLAAIFLYHGLEKVSAENRYGAMWHSSLPAPLQFATAWAELLAGVGLLAGFLTRASAAAGVLINAGAIYFIHGQYGFALQTGDAFKLGYEYKLTVLIMCLAVLVLGGGTFAVDWFFREMPPPSEAGRRQASPEALALVGALDSQD